MKTEKLEGKIETAFGKTMAEHGRTEPILYSGEVTVFETAEEVRSAGEWPNDKTIVSMVNQARKNNERAKLMNAAIADAGIQKPTLENDQQLQLKTLIKVYVAAGKSEAEAQQIAETSLGVKLSD